jgi:3D (Asp-Asp-Asp) domain-containing protein
MPIYNKNSLRALKNPVFKTSLGQEASIFLLLAVFLVAAFIFFNICSQKALANLAMDSTEGKLAFLEKNTLMSLVSPAGPEFKVVRKVNVVITAYSSTPLETDDTPFVTASNTQVREGIVANNYFPFGTKIRIPELYGDKIFTVEDRMSWKKSNYHIDVWASSYQEAKNFGVKRTYIEVVEG